MPCTVRRHAAVVAPVRPLTNPPPLRRLPPTTTTTTAQVRNLDEHITSTAERVKEGSQELAKADRSSRAARNKCLWLWLVAAVIVSIILIIMLA